MQQAQRIADHTYFMYLGEVKESGPTQDIFENPKHEMTKNYINGVFG
jgi:phosphate transport system ATP-binding protein